MKKTEIRNLFYQFFLIVATLILLAQQLHHLWHYPIWRDDAFFASVAKNLVLGNGYSAVFFAQNYPFSHGISSGPILILPAAFLMHFFGNQFWVPGLANIVLIWSLLLLIFFLSKDLTDKATRFPFCLMALYFCVVFTLGEYGNENMDYMTLWHLMMGEIPAAFLVVAGVFMIFPTPLFSRKFFLGGLCLGLAIITKTITAIAVAVVFVAILLKILRQKKFELRQFICDVAKVSAVIAAPFLLFEIVKIAALGMKYFDLLAVTQNHYRVNAMTVRNAQSYSWHLVYLWRLFDPATIFVLPVTLFLMFQAHRHRRYNSRGIDVGIVLIICGFLHGLWWIFCSMQYSDRYMVVGLIYYVVGLCLLVMNVDYSKMNRLQILVIITFVFLLFNSRSHEFSYLIHDGFKQQNDTALQDQLQTAKTIQDLQNKGIKIIALSNNFELEYLISRANNFEKFNSKTSYDNTILVSHLLNSNPDYILSIDHDEYCGRIRQLPNEILTKCNRKYSRSKTFALNWCE